MPNSVDFSHQHLNGSLGRLRQRSNAHAIASCAFTKANYAIGGRLLSVSYTSALKRRSSHFKGDRSLVQSFVMHIAGEILEKGLIPAPSHVAQQKNVEIVGGNGK